MKLGFKLNYHYGIVITYALLYYAYTNAGIDHVYDLMIKHYSQKEIVMFIALLQGASIVFITWLGDSIFKTIKEVKNKRNSKDSNDKYKDKDFLPQMYSNYVTSGGSLSYESFLNFIYRLNFVAIQEMDLTISLEDLTNSIDELFVWANKCPDVTPPEVLENVKVIENYIGIRKSSIKESFEKEGK